MDFKNSYKSTHDSKWFSGTSFKSTHDSNGFPNFWFKSTHDSQSFQEFWFRSTHDSKGFPEFRLQSTHNQKKNPQCWSEATHDWALPLLLGLSRIGLDLVWPCLHFSHSIWIGVTFLVFRIKCLPKKLIRINSRLKQYLGNLNWFYPWLKWLSMELTQNQLSTQADPQVGIDSDRLVAQAKNI